MFAIDWEAARQGVSAADLDGVAAVLHGRLADFIRESEFADWDSTV